MELLRHVKLNCKQIQLIHLFGNHWQVLSPEHRGEK